MLDQVAQDRAERLVIVGLDRDPCIARIGPVHADLALADLERSAHQEDAIQDLGQEQRVDDMAANLDLLDHARPFADSAGSRRSRLRAGSCWLMVLFLLWRTLFAFARTEDSNQA